MIIVEVPDEYLKKILGYGSSGAEIIDRSRNKKNIWKPLKTVVIFVNHLLKVDFVIFYKLLSAMALFKINFLHQQYKIRV